MSLGRYTESITLASGVSVYGGFSGTESSLSERDVDGNVTAVDGNGADHVVVMNAIGNARLDGLTIMGGNATDAGGGIYCISVDSTNTLEKCTIMMNGALAGSSLGGGLYLESSSPDITNCTISQNAALAGGGICCWSSSNPALDNCLIVGNEATQGGGIYSSLGCAPSFMNCTISGNFATNEGGGVYCNGSSPSLLNCNITSNRAELGPAPNDGGGVYAISDSDPEIVNCVFVDNTNYAIHEDDAASDPLVTYCLFESNPDGDYYDENTTG